MFQKILIANRGEIAVRVMRTCRRMGIRTVAVHSDADRNALFVEMADEAVSLGGETAAESYLRADKVIAAALKTGAEAVHPGYGFLSENPEFADSVAAAGLRFIGPPASAIRAMGLKDAAKAAMETAGVPVVPGYHGTSQDPAFLLEQARRIGFPVLIKARAGGGGKGMRRVEREADFLSALESAAREAEASFGDPACLIEKYVAHPRHIEIQVFGDDHGNVVHLFERDCSLQRRHQKVIEEAPAPGMPEEMRAAMGDAAVRAAKAIGYSGAGTVEFIADASEGLRMDRFWFMEMNTRLQVEHPITEAITGQDLVEWQLRVANGEPLPKRQDELAINGWAFEARLYAEDVGKGFLPATGRIAHLDLPSETARIDSGVRSGDVITPFYDPMIAKVIAHGATREAALAGLSAALRDVRVGGLVTNTAFLERLCRQADFAAGRPDTGLIAREIDRLAVEPTAGPASLALAALCLSDFLDPPDDEDPWASLSGFRLWSEPEEVVVMDHQGARQELRLSSRGGGRWHVRIGGDAFDLAVRILGHGRYRIGFEGSEVELHVTRNGKGLTLFSNGSAWSFALADLLDQESTGSHAGDHVTAPMPGLVKQLRVKPGERVEEGASLAVMEAMKMELTLSAPRAGVIAAVRVAVGEQVEAGALLIDLEPEDG
jgi:3-methylcrotonyl-CoA carboxylase alpha subunit